MEMKLAAIESPEPSVFVCEPSPHFIVPFRDRNPKPKPSRGEQIADNTVRIERIDAYDNYASQVKLHVGDDYVRLEKPVDRSATEYPIRRAIAKLIDAAIAEEREACAKVCESVGRVDARFAAPAIRSRE